MALPLSNGASPRCSPVDLSGLLRSLPGWASCFSPLVVRIFDRSSKTKRFRGSSSDNDVSDSPSRSAGLSPEHHLQSIVWVKQAQLNTCEGKDTTQEPTVGRKGLHGPLPC
ncbi:hypothetical protein EYF80_008931 [Liparis tanakae]|uniref:Uncharacterized protein n=1 Tax=Liparis tanakae TaxID=230148 RepID=A0A4Z2ISU8_9TELE|nr:hypothetical protein EYF80_008931 [Liparis tanakae]